MIKTNRNQNTPFVRLQREKYNVKSYSVNMIYTANYNHFNLNKHEKKTICIMFYGGL